MGAPISVAAALAKTRTGRRIAIGILAALALVVAFLLTPLVAIPFAIAGSSVSSAIDGDVRPAANGEWGYPLDGDYFKGRGYGYHPVDGCGYCSTNHKGYDMAQACGVAVHAAGPGHVVIAGAYGGFGNAVRIDHGDGLTTIYGHMQWNSLRVSVGDTVSAGTPLGAEGNTGNSVGCHVHFEVRQDDTAIDPEPFMAALGLPLK